MKAQHIASFGSNLVLLPKLFTRAWRKFGEDKAERLGAALAFYTTFSLAPLLVLTLSVVGIFYSSENFRSKILAEFNAVLGSEGAKLVETMMESTQEPAAGFSASLIGFLLLLFGASRVFLQLQQALNTVWNVPRTDIPGGVKGMVVKRLLSFSLVLALAFVLLVSLVVQSIVSALFTYSAQWLPIPEAVAGLLGSGLSFLTFVLLLMILHKFLPDRTIPWSSACCAALFTAFFFLLGQILFGLYLSKAAVTSSFGAAGSFVALLLWIYFSAQIFLFGAELGQAWSERREYPYAK